MTKIFIKTFIIIFSLCISSCNSNFEDEKIYISQIRQDFLDHKKDVITIDEINSKIVKRIDFLLDGERKDVLNKNLVKGIMNTRSYNTTIVAYRDILNGNYISDTKLKLYVARHIAYFEGIALSKRMWSQQWDHTARPYLYDNGLFKSSSKKSNLISDPIFRTVLWDRRMFAHDVEIKTPKLLNGIDSVILRIDDLIAVDKEKN